MDKTELRRRIREKKRAMTPEEIEERSRELGIKPYVMPYRDFDNKTRPSQYAKDLAQYVNKPMLFKSCSFKDFSPRKGFRCEAYFHTNNTITN